MILLIDIGNSQLKWLSHDGKSFSSVSRYSYQPDPSFKHCFKEVTTPPELIYFISVSSDTINVALKQACLSKWGLKPIHMITGHKCGGVINGYEQPESLGVDRWAAMIGAYQKYRMAVAVVDSGTASTLDVVDSQGIHRGGAVIPGLDMMRQSLVSGTIKIIVSEATSQASSLGRTTTECIELGTKEATAGFIDRMVSQAEQVVSEPLKTVITGGAGRALLDIICHDAIYEENLVFLGMLEMLKSYRDGETS